MNTQRETLAIYEEMAQISAQMLDAARAADWNLLSVLELRNIQLLGKLQQHAANETGDATQAGNRDDALRDRKVAMIKTILAHDRDIRELTEPWLYTLSGLIQNTSNERKLAAAYGAGMSG
jgi:flagellar protein FliT